MQKYQKTYKQLHGVELELTKNACQLIPEITDTNLTAMIAARNELEKTLNQTEKNRCAECGNLSASKEEQEFINDIGHCYACECVAAELTNEAREHYNN